MLLKEPWNIHQNTNGTQKYRIILLKMPKAQSHVFFDFVFYTYVLMGVTSKLRIIFFYLHIVNNFFFILPLQ